MTLIVFDKTMARPDKRDKDWAEHNRLVYLHLRKMLRISIVVSGARIDGVSIAAKIQPRGFVNHKRCRDKDEARLMDRG